MNEENLDNPYASNGNASKNGRPYNGAEHYSGENIPNSTQEKEEIDLKHLIATAIRYKWWVISITFVCTAVAFFYARSLDPVYTSSGTIVIEEQRNTYTYRNSDISSIVSNSFGVGSGSRLVNEIQVFKSRRLAGEIARKVLEEETMVTGEQFPITWYSYPEDSTMVGREVLTRRIQNRMQVQRVDMDTDIIRVSYNSISPHEAEYLVNTTLDTYTEVSANQRRMAANSALDFLEEEQQEAKQQLENSEENLREYMSRTNLIEVDGQTNAVINRIAELESQLQQVQVERVSINSSIDAYENQLDQIRPGLAEQFADNVSSTMERRQFRLAELETERDLILQRNPALRNNPEQEPQLVQLNEEIKALKNDINQLAAELIGDESDVFIGFLNSEDGGITNRIIDLRQQLIELRIQESQLNAKENVLNERLEEENEFFDNLPENMIDLARLRRDNQVNERLYTTISENFTQTQLWKQTQFGAGRPLDYGIVPDAPSGPNRTRYIMIGFLLGGMLSVGFVFVRENLNHRIDGTEKIRKMGYPLLAVIPDIKEHVSERFSKKQFITLENRKISTSWTAIIDTINPIAESYRRLHNNIIYSDPDQTFNTIVITSSKKGEGKTTIAINLAVTLAESGKKVLVIDCDLRRPNVHKFTGEDREPGVGELFYDDEKLENAIRATVAPGVDVLTAGRKIPNPSAVMQSKKMKKLLETVHGMYDHVIIDTPPFGVITDAAPVLKQADTVVLISKFNITQTNELNHTIENLERIRANIAGTVITAFDHKESADYYYSGKYSLLQQLQSLRRIPGKELDFVSCS
ncbi:MAG: polysaccharide biosynthesis tyrosine autokinase [Balneolaceae bacterium]|nr:polysaccharide biosynthesis tyrosine autokinase [Balneolaceae bacterium]